MGPKAKKAKGDNDNNPTNENNDHETIVNLDNLKSLDLNLWQKIDRPPLTMLAEQYGYLNTQTLLLSAVGLTMFLHFNPTESNKDTSTSQEQSISHEQQHVNLDLLSTKASNSERIPLQQFRPSQIHDKNPRWDRSS